MNRTGIERWLERLYRAYPPLLMARRNVARNRTRSALAMAGITIGVLAIASLGLFGTALQASAVGAFGDTGNEIVVTPAFGEGVTELSDTDVSRIERVAEDAAVAPVHSDTAPVKVADERRVVTVYGIERAGSIYSVADGRLADRHPQGAAVGSELADQYDIRPGNTITISDEQYRVVAVLERGGDFSPVSPNHAVILPPDQVAPDADGYSEVIVRAESPETASVVAEAIREELNDREQRATVIELREVTEALDSFFSVLTTFLVGIGAISLLVAGVSILTIMLITTIERREEIGTLRAVGVSKRDVMMMVLLETGLLGVVGSVIGVVIAIVVGLLLNVALLDDLTELFRSRNLFYVALAFAFGIVTSVLSGLYPARKAANERPVETLRG